MHPKFMTKVITYVTAFSLTILMTIAWFAHFGTITQFVCWTIDDTVYEINLPRIGGDEIE